MPHISTRFIVRRPPPRTAVPLLIVTVASLATASAFADGDAARSIARARLEEGAQRLAAGDNAGALSDFEEAYRLYPSPKIQFDIGLANFRLGRNPAAYRAFERFLTGAADAAPEAVTGARARLEVLRPKIASVAVVCPRAGLAVSVDDTTVGRTPLGEPLYLEPGPHRIETRVGERGPTLVAKSFVVTEGQQMNVELPIPMDLAASDGPAVRRQAAPAPPALASTEGRASPSLLLARPRAAEEPSTSAASPRPIYHRPWFWVAGAGVAAAAALTLWLTVGHSAGAPNASLGRVNLPGQP